jgi:hypothetical protein
MGLGWGDAPPGLVTSMTHKKASIPLIHCRPSSAFTELLRGVNVRGGAVCLIFDQFGVLITCPM